MTSRQTLMIKGLGLTRRPAIVMLLCAACGGQSSAEPRSVARATTQSSEDREALFQQGLESANAASLALWGASLSAEQRATHLHKLECFWDGLSTEGASPAEALRCHVARQDAHVACMAARQPSDRAAFERCIAERSNCTLSPTAAQREAHCFSNERVMACEGHSLDLQWIVESRACDSSDEARLTIPDTVVFSVSNAIVIGNTEAVIALTLTNRAERPVTFDLDFPCGLPEPRIYAGEAHVDVNDACLGLRGCGARGPRITLAPWGEASARVVFSTTTRLVENDCRPVPLSPGEYTLETASMSGGDPVQSRLTIPQP